MNANLGKCNFCSSIENTEQCPVCQAVVHCSRLCLQCDWDEHKHSCISKRDVGKHTPTNENRELLGSGKGGRRGRGDNSSKQINESLKGDLPKSSKGEIVRTCQVCGQAGAKIKKCAKCKTVYYCGVACQKNDWVNHRRVCNNNTTVTVSKSCGEPGSDAESPNNKGRGNETKMGKSCTGGGSPFKHSEKKQYSDTHERVQEGKLACHVCNRNGSTVKWCSRCRSVAYCGVTCQKVDWEKHKAFCVSPRPETSDKKESKYLEIVKRCMSCGQLGATVTCTQCKEVLHCGLRCREAGWENHKVVCSYANMASENKSSGGGSAKHIISILTPVRPPVPINIQRDLSRKLIEEVAMRCSLCRQVTSKVERCSRCKSVGYCGPTCQVSDWENHELYCVRVSSITSSVAGGGTHPTCPDCFQAGAFEMCSMCKSYSLCKFCSCCCYCFMQNQQKGNNHESWYKMPPFIYEDEAGDMNYDIATGALSRRPVVNPEYLKPSDVGLSVYNDMQTRAFRMFPHMAVSANMNIVSFEPLYGYVLVTRISHLDRYMSVLGAFVQDRTDRQVILYFYNENAPEPYFQWTDVLPGNYICYLHPQLHTFLDGQTGFKITDSERVRILSR